MSCNYFYYFETLVSVTTKIHRKHNFTKIWKTNNSHSPALLDLFRSCDTSICSTKAFPPLENSDHVVVSVSIDFPTNSQQDAPFYSIAYDYSCADWGMVFVEIFHGRISLNLVLLLLLVNFLSGFRLELMYISLIENIRPRLIHLHGFQLLVLLP